MKVFLVNVQLTLLVNVVPDPQHSVYTAAEAQGLEGLGQTYLSMDVDGRVVRLDSFSKFLLPGMRLGWVTAHPDMLQKICFALHASTMGPCSYTQVSILIYANCGCCVSKCDSCLLHLHGGCLLESLSNPSACHWGLWSVCFSALPFSCLSAASTSCNGTCQVGNAFCIRVLLLCLHAAEMRIIHSF